MTKKEDKTKALVWTCQNLAPDEIVIQEDQEPDYEELKHRLAEYLNRLLLEDFNKLVSILYRIDVAQEKAAAALSKTTSPGDNHAGEALADLIIERQLEKLKTRRKYS